MSAKLNVRAEPAVVRGFTHESLGDLLDGATEGSMEVWVAPDSLPEVPVTSLVPPVMDLESTLTDGRLRLAVGESTCTTSQPVFAGDSSGIALNFQASTPYAKAYLDGERICDSKESLLSWTSNPRVSLPSVRI